MENIAVRHLEKNSPLVAARPLPSRTESDSIWSFGPDFVREQGARPVPDTLYGADARTINKLEQRDRQVRAKAESQGEALTGEQFIYQSGPDGELYAIGTRAHLVRQETEGAGTQAGPGPVDEKDLSAEDRALLEKLRQRDAKVRAHEASHVLAAGGQAGLPSYTYQTGPDGERYAIGGSVNISMISNGNPEHDARSARNAQRAAMANGGESSPADLQAAAKATRQEAEARRRALESYQQQAAFGYITS